MPVKHKHLVSGVMNTSIGDNTHVLSKDVMSMSLYLHCVLTHNR